jgi:hypothetical protein
LDANELIARVAEWSRQDDRVIAAGLCGSYARGEARRDSDVDFCILSADPTSLLKDRSWVYNIGSDARVIGPVEDYNLVQSIRVLFGTTEAEFGLTDEAWMQIPLDRQTAGVINAGLQVLYDPEGRLKKARICAADML